MGTFITRNNWYTRLEGAALFGWGTTITGPKATATNNINYDYNKEYFIGWPQKWVVKKPKNCGGNYGNLRLEVKTRFEECDGPGRLSGGAPYQTAVTDGTMVIWSNVAPVVYDSYEFTNGDDHVYSSVDYHITAPTTPPEYRYGTVDLSGFTDSGYIPGSDTGGLEAFLGNGVSGTDYFLYAGNWAGKMTPSDFFDYASPTDPGYWPYYLVTNATTYLYAHDPSGSHWSQTGSVSVLNYGGTPGGYGGYDYISSSAGITFVMDEDWTATGRLQKITSTFRWKYHPEGGAGCKFWENVQVEVKVLYKKAPVTKTDGPEGVFYSIGTWASAGNNTQTVTLHDKYSDEYVGTEVTMPTEEGYVYVIDDLEILTVTLP